VRFTLTYDGPLHIGNKAQGKQEVRESLHPQLRDLWQHAPLAGSTQLLTWEGEGGEPGHPGLSVITRVKDQVFAALVCKELRLSAELDVLFLRAGKAGVLIGQGDIDNRLKVLFDALSVPRPQMAENAPCSDGLGTEDSPLFTLLEDDELVTRVNVDTARLLGEWPDDHVRVIVRVDVRPTELIWGNMSFM
jgi:hypothetical protein